MAVEIERLSTITCSVGENPIWDLLTNSLTFIDMGAGFLRGTYFQLHPAIYRLIPSTGAIQHWVLPTAIGSMALREAGGAVLACNDGFHTFDFATGQRTLIGDPEAAQPQILFADGKVDRQGRFIAGTAVNAALGQPLGAIYRLDSDLTWHKLHEGFGVVNGPCWSPDGRQFYMSDSRRSTIFVYDYDIDSGTIANQRVFATTTELGGLPDGATVDAEGFLWSAICIGGRIARFAPDGRVDRVIEMPVQWVASITFGGPALDVLYATSIDPIIYETTGRGPDEGGLFAIHGLGVRGISEPRFAG